MNESEQGVLAMRAPYVLEYTYRRSTGPVLGRFLSGLIERRIEGVKTKSGAVLVPPMEYDPETSEACDEWVEVGQGGVVQTWAWVERPRANQPLDRPFAWALVKLDGATSPMLHAVDAGSIDNMKTGMRVKVRWRDQRVGMITDIVCFEPEVQP